MSETEPLFLSFDALQKANTALLKRYYAQKKASPEFMGEVRAFVERGRATGARLDSHKDRQVAQALLDYWVTVFYRANEEPPDTTLDELDEDALKRFLQTADEIYNSLSDEAKDQARRVFLHLIRPIVPKEYISRPVSRSELYRAAETQDDIEHVLSRFIKTSIIHQSEDATTIEVADMALVRNWKILGDWLNEVQPVMIELEDLEKRAERWSKGEGDLLDMRDCAAAENWLNSPDAAKVGYNNTLMRFVQASRTELERRARQKMWWQVVLWLLFSFIVIAIMATWFWRNEQIARQTADEQRSQVIAFESRDVLKEDPELSLLLALEAVRIDQNARTRSALYQAVVESRVRLRLDIDEKAGYVFDAVYSPDGQRIVTAMTGTLLVSGTVTMWNAKTGKPLNVLGTYDIETKMWSVAYTGTLVAASINNTVQLWDAESGKALATLQGHTDRTTGIAFSPDGKILASGSKDSTVVLWNANTTTPMRTLHGHTGAIMNVAFSPDGQLLASTSLDKTARIWSVATGEPLGILEAVYTSGVLSSAFHPNPEIQNLIASSWDGTVRIWNITRSITPRYSLPKQLTGVTSVLYSPDGKHIATANAKGRLEVWNAITGQNELTLQAHSGQIDHISYSPDGQHIVTASRDGTSRVWFVGNDFPTIYSGNSSLNQAAFLPDGEQIVTQLSDGTVRWMNVSQKEWNAKMPSVTGAVTVTRAMFSPSGALVATVTNAHPDIVQVWSLATETPVVQATLQGHSGQITALAFSFDGQRIATASEASNDGTARLWDATTGKQIRTIVDTHPKGVRSVSFSPDGERIVTVDGESRTQIWDTATGNEDMVLQGHTKNVASAVFSPDGLHVITAGWDQTARVWDTSNGKEVLTLNHTDEVKYASFSPDGKLIGTITKNEESAQVWDAQTGEKLFTLPESKVQGISFATNPLGKQSIAVFGLGHLRVYPINVPDAQELEKRRTTRTLTPDEREQYLGEGKP